MEPTSRNGGVRRANGNRPTAGPTRIDSLGRPQPTIRTRPKAGKRTGLPVGVSRRTRVDERHTAANAYVEFLVNWQDARGINRVSTFSGGNAERASTRRIGRAKAAAIAFRSAYERATVDGAPFDAAQARWSVARG